VWGGVAPARARKRAAHVLLCVAPFWWLVSGGSCLSALSLQRQSGQLGPKKAFSPCVRDAMHGRTLTAVPEGDVLVIMQTQPYEVQHHTSPRDTSTPSNPRFQLLADLL
jgi:uncharacterized membrane protein YgcG